MPAVHIGEAVFSELVQQEGGYDAAKEKVKELAKTEVKDE